MPAATAAAAASRVWAVNWPFRTRRRLDGLRLVATDTDWTVGSGLDVAGSMRALLMLVTGRPVDAGALSGAGAARLLTTH